jgi:hypothetical protein
MRLLALVMLVGCADHGELPTGCDPDFQLTGSPGSQETLSYSLAGGESNELCLELDASENRADVTFLASAPFFPSATQLELFSVDGTHLASGDDTGTLRWVMPPGPRMHFLLEVSASQSVASVSGGLTLEFYELR